MYLFTLETVLQLAFLYGIMALAVSFSFRVIGFPDLTPDGALVLGAAIVGKMALNGAPVLVGISFAVIAGVAAGIVTALLHTRLGISKLLSGILVMLGLYSLSLRVMGASNLSLLNAQNGISSMGRQSGIVPVLATLLICFLVVVAILALLRTKLGLRLRATGDSETALELRGYKREPCYLIGLAFTNGLSAIGGAIIALYQGFVDISMGTGLVVTCLTAMVMGETILRPEKVHFLIACPILGMFLYQLVLSIALQSGFTPGDLKISTALLALGFISIDRIRIKRGGVSRQIGNRTF